VKEAVALARHTWAELLLSSVALVVLFQSLKVFAGGGGGWLGDTMGTTTFESTLTTTVLVTESITTTVQSVVTSTMTYLSSLATIIQAQPSTTVLLSTTYATYTTIATATALVITEQNPLNTYLPVLAAVVGALVGVGGTWTVQHRILRTQDRGRINQTIYAPLLDELEAESKKVLSSFEKMNRKEWNRVKSEHLVYQMDKRLRDLVSSIYDSSEPKLIASATVAIRAVSSELHIYLKSRWQGRSETITVQTSPNSTQTGLFYNLEPYKKLIGERLFRSIALDDDPPSAPDLQAALETFRGNMNLPFEDIDGLVEFMRKLLADDARVRSFRSDYEACQSQIDEALRLLRRKLER
jgi:hypothetical protein